MSALQLLESFILNPKNHDLLSILKGARNGFVYGCKIRFPHAVVMTFLFSSKPFRQKLTSILRATYNHALNLSKFVTIYKTLLLLQRKLNLGGTKDGNGRGKERSLDTFVAGLIGGWIVFGERNAINEQIVLYVSSRVLASFLSRSRSRSSSSPSSSTPPPSSTPYGPLTPLPNLPPLLSTQSNPKPLPPDEFWFRFFAAICWGGVMWIYRNRGERLQPGLVNSMKYLYRDSEHWTSLKTLLWHNT